MTMGVRTPEPVRLAILRDLERNGDNHQTVAIRHGIDPQTLSRWIAGRDSRFARFRRQAVRSESELAYVSDHLERAAERWGFIALLWLWTHPEDDPEAGLA